MTATVPPSSIPPSSSSDRRRSYDGPALFLHGFRPFFLGGALWAALATPLWVAALAGEASLPFALDSFDWHRHEMIFGWLSAVIAGFLLTAVPNWTGRLPVVGWPLAGLAGLWLVGRLGLLLGGSPAWPLLALAGAFPVLLAALLWREVTAGNNRKNMPIAGLITLYAAGDVLFLSGETALGVRVGLGTVMLLIAVIGGRVTPSFTRNWLVKQGPGRLPAEFGLMDKLGMAAAAVAVLSWIGWPGADLSGGLLILAGVVTALRLARWAGYRVWGEPLVTVLHAGYGFLALGMMLTGLDILQPGHFAGLHAFTVGAIGLMTLAIMTRATLGHTGRDLHAGPATVAIYGLVALAAVTRVLAPTFAAAYTPLIHGSALLWSAGFLLYVAIYGPMLVKPRR